MAPPETVRGHLNGARVAVLEARFSETLATLVEMYGGTPYRRSAKPSSTRRASINSSRGSPAAASRP
jgi:hypothetical protein